PGDGAMGRWGDGATSLAHDTATGRRGEMATYPAPRHPAPDTRPLTPDPQPPRGGPARNGFGGSKPLAGHPPTTVGEPRRTDDEYEEASTSAPVVVAVGGWSPNPRYTFRTFVVGSSNNLVHAAARSVAAEPGRSYNPLFIYGGVGLGKTHLLHAIAHEALQKGLAVRYCSTEQFTNELINAIREHRTEDFRNRYRAMDVLLVDDIQFIAGKESTQEEFFHTFNALHEASRQVVISSDRAPKSIPTLEARLRSRFEWGLIADIQPPDLETRTAILLAKAREARAEVGPEVLGFLAQRIQSNIRELEGALTRVVAFARLTNRPLTVETAASAIADLLTPAQRRYIDARQIVDAVGRYYKVSTDALRGKARDAKIVLPRQVAMYLMREETEASLLHIGRELGNRDHTTVLHGCTKIQTEIEANSQLRREVLAIRDLLYENARP
ncbi:MAG: chromosomal replication initiator protein DnaA, partial [Chloroflexi bacterium]|nr:chromosomal replication initiator protein DnaA [Chloroflexota bacterium]